MRKILSALIGVLALVALIGWPFLAGAQASQVTLVSSDRSFGAVRTVHGPRGVAPAIQDAVVQGGTRPGFPGMGEVRREPLRQDYGRGLRHSSGEVGGGRGVEAEDRRKDEGKHGASLRTERG